MKRIILMTAVGLVLVGGFVAARSHSRTSGSVAVTTPTPSTADGATVAPESAYRLIVIADAVTLKHPSDAAAHAVQGTVTVAVGDQVTTSATGRARLSWPNGTITTLEEDSQVTIQALSDNGSQSRITLIFGDIWSKVTRILGSGQYYEVETQDTVAAVRGTLFRTTYRNHRSRVQGIEHVVHVATRRADGTTDESNSIDVQEQTEIEVDHSTLSRRLALAHLTALELRDKVWERIKRERDLDDSRVRPSPSPTASATVRPTVTATPTSSPTPTSTPSSTPTPTATPSTVSLPPVTLDHVFPKSIGAGETFSLEGGNFTQGRNTSRIKAVSVGGQAAADFIVTVGGPSSSLFVTPGQLAPGTYDVSVTTTEDIHLTLSNAVTIH